MLCPQISPCAIPFRIRGDTCCLWFAADSGECYTFGGNQFGQLGVDGEVTPRAVQKVAALEHMKITRVACGDTFSTAVSEGLTPEF